MKERFVRTGARYTSPEGVYDTMTKDVSGYLFKTKSGIGYRFNMEGRLVLLTDPNGNQMNIKYGTVTQ